MSQTQHKDQGKGGKGNYMILAKDRTASPTVVDGLSGSFQELEQWNVPLLLQKYPSHVPCRGQCQADVSSGACRGFFYTARKGHLLPLLADKAKLKRPHQPGLKASTSLTSGLLMTSIWHQVMEPKQPSTPQRGGRCVWYLGLNSLHWQPFFFLQLFSPPASV